MPTGELERAVACMMLAALTLPIVNACAKYLAGYPVVQITWARYAGHFGFMVLVFGPTSGLAILKTSRLGLQLLRSTLHCASAGLTFYAVAFLPLPTVTAVSFTAPLIVTALAPFALGERFALHTSVAVTAGFAGALIVVRPGASSPGPVILVMFASAVLSAVIQLLSRKLARADGALTSNTYMVLVGFVILSAPLPWLWRTPIGPVDLGVFLAIGVSGGIGHYFLVRAFEIAPATFVSPFNYAQIIGAALLGYLVFGQLPDLWTWIGAGLIVGSGTYVLVRERRSADRFKPGAGAPILRRRRGP